MAAAILRKPYCYFYREVQKASKEDSSYRILQIAKKCFCWLASMLAYPLYFVGKLFSTNPSQVPILEKTTEQIEEEWEEIPFGLSADSQSSDFADINGNWVLGNSAIACEGPSLSDQKAFWEVVWDNNLNSIVMLTDYEKGAEYWPKKQKQSLTMGEILITMQEKPPIPAPHEIKIRDFFLSREGFPDRELRHYHLCGWDDQSIVSPDLFLRYVNVILNFAQEPMIVHGGKEVGKTGVLLATVKVIQELKEGNKNPNLIAEIVEDLLSKRDGIIQNGAQYKLIYDTVKLWMESQSSRQKGIGIQI